MLSWCSCIKSNSDIKSRKLERWKGEWWEAWRLEIMYFIIMPFLLLKTPVAKHWRFNRFPDLAVIEVLPSILHGKVLLWHYGKERMLQSDIAQRNEQWFQVNFIPAPLPGLRENSVPLKTKWSNVFFWFKSCSQLYCNFMRVAEQQAILYYEFYLKGVTRTQKSCMHWGFFFEFFSKLCLSLLTLYFFFLLS